MYNILICDDEKDIVNALKIYLSAADMNFYEATNGEEALEILAREEIHLILLDIMMPKLDGISALVKLRESSNVPVILLTARCEDTDKILGLNVGADDYITKPFNPVEVNARVRSQLRRYLTLGGKLPTQNYYAVGGVELNDLSKEVCVDGVQVNLTPTEYEILRLLMMHPGKVFSPREIYETVWKENLYGSENIVAVHIRHIREKIEINPTDPRYLKVIWGQGYKMEAVKQTRI